MPPLRERPAAAPKARPAPQGAREVKRSVHPLTSRTDLALHPPSKARSSGGRMHILVIGSGGREHALAWKAKESPLVSRITSAPGNVGMAGLGDCVAIDATDAATIVTLCRREKVEFVIIGPDA